MTNFEKIKNMSIEELANLIFLWIDCTHCPIQLNCFPSENCIDVCKRWLKSEVKE